MRRVMIEHAANVVFQRLLVARVRDARGEQVPRHGVVGIEGEEPPKRRRRLVEPAGPAGGAREALVGVDVIGFCLERAREQRGRSSKRPRASATLAS